MHQLSLPDQSELSAALHLLTVLRTIRTRVEPDVADAEGGERKNQLTHTSLPLTREIL